MWPCVADNLWSRICSRFGPDFTCNDQPHLGIPWDTQTHLIQKHKTSTQIWAVMDKLCTVCAWLICDHIKLLVWFCDAASCVNCFLHTFITVSPPALLSQISSEQDPLSFHYTDLLVEIPIIDCDTPQYVGQYNARTIHTPTFVNCISVFFMVNIL
jgi:hypothetical protein